MQFQNTSRPPGRRWQPSARGEAELVLSYTELAVALVASDMPTRRCGVDVERVAVFAEQGVARLGLVAVRSRAVEAERWGREFSWAADRYGAYLSGREPGVASVVAAYNGVWGCSKLRQAHAHDLASRLLNARLAGVA